MRTRTVVCCLFLAIAGVVASVLIHDAVKQHRLYEKYEQVRVGMKASEVDAILGREKLSDGHLRHFHSFWEEDGGTSAVSFTFPQGEGDFTDPDEFVVQEKRFLPQSWGERMLGWLNRMRK
jgi:hypothetical protein